MDMEVMHSCDTPLCVNPRHLRKGTHVENVRDMHLKQRQGKSGKMTLGQAIEIRRHLAYGELIKDIATLFGVSRATVSYINSGKNWKRAT